MPGAPWFAEGLQFTCTQCGKCCTGEPGFTWVSDAEVLALAARYGLDEAAFRRKYTRTVHRDGVRETSLTEARSGDCVFWDKKKGCTVYDLRPLQCRTWPFWRSNLVSAEHWADAALDCPGMNHGALHGAEEIAATAADDGLPV